MGNLQLQAQQPTFTAMEFIDLILGGLLLFGLVKGLWKGLFTELASVVSLLAGIFIAIKFSGAVGKMLEGHVDNPKHVAITAFVLVFIGVVVGIMLLAKTFTKLASFAGLGLVNRLLGGLFGLIKMALILSVSLNFFQKLNANNTFAKKETLDNSLFFHPVLKISNTIFPVLEEWFTEKKAKSTAPETEDLS
jgi:membrane protein required for colicin V production